jgi:hypothetical protein
MGASNVVMEPNGTGFDASKGDAGIKSDLAKKFNLSVETME